MARLKRTAEKPVNGKKTFIRLMGYISGEYKLITIIGLLVITIVITHLSSSYMLRPIINDYIIPYDIPGLIGMLALLGGIYLTGLTATFVQNRFLIKIGQKTVARMRRDLFRKMDTLPVGYFDKNQHGDLMSRFTNDIDRISDVLTDSLAYFLNSSLMLISIFCFMLYISPLLTAVVLFMVPVMFLSAGWIVKKSRKYFSAQQKALGEVNGYIEEMISGEKVIKVFGQEEKVLLDFETLNGKLGKESEKAQIYSGMMMPFMQNFNTLNYVAVTVVGALLAIFRGLDIGGLAAFLQYSRQFGGPVNELASLYNNLQSALAGAERIFQVMDECSEPVDSKDACSLKGMKGNIVFDRVTFGYEPGQTVLKEISFSVKAGQKVAFVGTTGAGKTTILSMLPRFFDIDSGLISIDDKPLCEIARKELRRGVATVLQDTHLFTGTVRENIRFGRLDATDEEVVEAARLTAAHSFIKRLPEGYDTMLENDGANLSQGQRQLLNIARAAVARPVILLLDEATSNIDTNSELKIQKGLEQLMEGRTSIIIAHRLSTVRHADCIFVMENGEIIEQGIHEELMNRKGKYYTLYQTNNA